MEMNANLSVNANKDNLLSDPKNSAFSFCKKIINQPQLNYLKIKNFNILTNITMGVSWLKSPVVNSGNQ